MGSCIICGTSTDGRICDLHEEDVVFEFRGNRPDQLTVDRFYRGTVDGYAEFGVFVDIGDSVTGLLHRSELDQRLESLDWDAGDTVFVQVTNVRDNGNVDLTWSIRQSESEFRGTLVDDPEKGAPFVKSEEESSDDAEGSGGGSESGGDDAVDPRNAPAATESPASEARVTGDDTDASSGAGDETATGADEASGGEVESRSGSVAGGSDDDGGAAATAGPGGSAADAAGTESATTAASGAGTGAVEVEEPEQVTVDSLADRVGESVRIEGVVETARQTSGPTVFEVRDETGAVECAAFEAAGVRAYPEIGVDDVVRLEGEVRERRNEIQVETEALVVLEEEEREAVQERLDAAIRERADPGSVDPLVDDVAVTALTDGLREAATAVRRAVLEERPVVVRHTATADGYVAGVALERATLPLVRDHHEQHDAVYHYFDRRPLEEGVYDMDDATRDVTNMLDARERHGEKLPLFVFVAVGATRDSLDGFELLDLYDAGRVVIDDVAVDPEIPEAVDALVAPDAEHAARTTATTLAANVAAHVNDEVRADLGHLPAVSFWEDPPEAYVEAAADAGYDEDATREVREAVALEAFYQSYEDKRELVTDLLFGDGDGPGGLAGHISEQFREKLAAEVETADANLDHQTLDETTIAVLDSDAFTHRYEFPPTSLLLDELHRRHRDEVDAVVGVSDDELHVRTDAPLDVRDVADRAREWVPNAGIAATNARDGKLEYVAGERSAVLDAVVDVVADELA
ncbi:MAG: OB-fold nucleic acid binding domain-containing protein [Haloarculaceae archaeon]